MRRMVAVALMALAAAACGSTAGGSSMLAGFAGYKWSVVAIGHDGKETSIPARFHVNLEFSPNGQFGATDPVNGHGGTYRVTGAGFTTSNVASTLVGYIGKDPVALLAIDAISSFGNDASATVRDLSRDMIAIAVNGYTLTCQRAGVQANFPPAAHT
jgi:hypothetical protein